MKLRGVILDVDGTLIDSNDAHARSWQEVFREYGHEVDYEAIRERIGKGGDKLMPEITGITKDTELGKEISARRARIFHERYLPGLKPFPDARKLLERMKAEGLELAVATSAQKDESRALLRKIGVLDLLDSRTSSDDAAHSKPDPDIIEAALKKLGMGPEEVLMLGDTPYDIEAAERAGIRPVALRCGGWSDAALQEAVAIYEDPADLLKSFERSPFGMSPRRKLQDARSA